MDAAALEGVKLGRTAQPSRGKTLVRLRFVNGTTCHTMSAVAEPAMSGVVSARIEGAMRAARACRIDVHSAQQWNVATVRGALAPLANEYAMRVEPAPPRAALWEEVNDKGAETARGLSGGQHQRSGIARSAVKTGGDPAGRAVLGARPTSTAEIGAPMDERPDGDTLSIVTHNLQPAGRVSGHPALMYLDDW